MKTRRRTVSTSLAYALPSKPNSPPENLDDYCAFIYGRKQWGKSTLASQYPEALNFQFEPGRRGLRIMQVPSDGSKLLWEPFIEYLGLFLESDDFKVGVIDTIDRAYDLCLEHVCLRESNGQHNHPNKFGQEGYAMWDFVKSEFEAVFQSIRDAGKIFVCVSHDKKVKQKDRDGAEWERIEPTCKPAAWKIAQAMCDLVFHCEFIGGQRVISVRDLDNSSLASCNPDIDCFCDPDGNTLRRFTIPNEKGSVYESLQRAFNNELRDFDYTPPSKLKEKLAAKRAAGTEKKTKFVKRLPSKN